MKADGQNVDKADLAADVIRGKIDKLYSDEPEVKDELRVIKTARRPSKHQNYMLKLQRSGKSMAEIQTAWHEYYQNLNSEEKHEVWQEFYASYEDGHYFQPAAEEKTIMTGQNPTVLTQHEHNQKQQDDELGSTHAEVRQKIIEKVNARAKKKGKPSHTRSLIFGLGCGLLSMFIVMFGFYNERFIAPFITPSRSASAAPLIIDPSQIAVDPSPKIIIPKINVEVPVVFDETTGEEKKIQDALENGVVKYASSVNPGEKGNVVIVGHSSNNLLNQGKYKFAFVWLSKLEDGDLFYIHKDGIRYTYKVFQKRIVKPTDVDVLFEVPRPNTATLITCDPPGTAKNRLVVNAEQISPDPNGNKPAIQTASTPPPKQVPGNAESLFQRFKNWLF